MRGSNDYKVKYERINKKLEQFMELSRLNFFNITLNDIEKFIVENFVTISRSAYYDSVRCLNDILKNNKVNIHINSKLYADKCVKVSDKQYLDLDEVKRLCDVLRNASDKFICYGLFKGIYGRNYSDLLEITVDMIAEDCSYIKLPSGKKFECDEYMQEILKNCLKENVYYKHVLSSELKANDYYELAPSKYLIKPMPTNKNNNGYGTLSPSSLQRRFEKFADIFKEETNEDITLTGTSLNKSGILYDMYCQEVEFGKEWKNEAVDQYLKDNGIKFSKNDMHHIYHSRYDDEIKNENRLDEELSKEIIKSVNDGVIKEPLNVKSILNLCYSKYFNYSKTRIIKVLSNRKCFKEIKKDEYIVFSKYRDILFEEEVEKSKQDSAENRNQRLSKIKNTKLDIYITTLPRFKRNPDVVAEVLSRAKGKCEECKNKAPFIRKSDNTPYLEVHHIVSLSDGGDDTVENCIAVCPNCHRKLHYGQ